jgi:hypothetical protein
MDDKLVTVAQYTNSAEASLARQMLADFGIESVLSGENFSVMYPVPSLVNVELQVLGSHVERAQEILESNKESTDAGAGAASDDPEEQ